jgi:DNA mismatch endonuclease, patch repair protein
VTVEGPIPDSAPSFSSTLVSLRPRIDRAQVRGPRPKKKVFSMADTISALARSQLMARIRGKDTKPEMVVRALLHGLGYRYRLHARDLPGQPDILFRSRQKAVFINGCFWHWHSRASCKIARLPKSRTDYWLAKFTRNRARDQRTINELRQSGWKVLVIWECETRQPERLAPKLTRFLGQVRLRRPGRANERLSCSFTLPPTAS